MNYILKRYEVPTLDKVVIGKSAITTGEFKDTFKADGKQIFINIVSDHRSKYINAGYDIHRKNSFMIYDE